MIERHQSVCNQNANDTQNVVYVHKHVEYTVNMSVNKQPRKSTNSEFSSLLQLPHYYKSFLFYTMINTFHNP